MKRILLLFVLLCPVQSVSAMDYAMNIDYAMDYVLSLLGYRLNEQLFKVISQDGSVDEISQLIEKGADVNAKDKLGYTPLVMAAKGGLSDVCMKLVELGADVNARDKHGDTPLIRAAKRGHSKMCMKLIELGADVNAKDKWGLTPLLCAAKEGYSAKEGHSDVCMKLIELGADVNVKDKNGWSPLTYAARNGHVDSVKAIIEQTLIGGNVEVSKAKLYTHLCCFREKKICKDIRLHLLSFNQEVLPFLIYLAIHGCALPPQLKNAIAIELNNRRKFLKSLIVKAQKHAKTDEIKSILSRHMDLLKF